jgi:hypothetical protein
LSKANNIMHSCCILHNWLLSYDGLDTLWTEEDYLSTWWNAFVLSFLKTHCLITFV